MRDLVEIATTDPPRLLVLAWAGSKLRSASPSLAWSCSQYAISDGGGFAAVGCNGDGGHTYGMRKHGEFGIFFVIL